MTEIIFDAPSNRMIAHCARRVDEGSAQQAAVFGSSVELAERTALALAVQVAEHAAGQGILDGAYTVRVKIIPEG